MTQDDVVWMSADGSFFLTKTGFGMNYGGLGGNWPSGAPCKRCKKVMVAWGVQFCEECKKFITSCPATHAKASESCNLCRDMPGYVEVIQ